jgi:hypothetical protein
MPAVAAGREEWTEDERRHLAGCAACAGEYDLVRATAALGAAVAATLDGSSLGARAVERLAAERAGATETVAPAGVGRRQLRWAAAAIAAAVLLAVAALLARGAATSSVSPAGEAAAQIELAELEALDEEELETVLRELDAALDAALDAETEDTDRPGPVGEPVTWEG